MLLPVVVKTPWTNLYCSQKKSHLQLWAKFFSSSWFLFYLSIHFVAKFQEKSVGDAGWHVRQRQPEELGVPPRRVSSARVNGGDGVLHAADHLHQVRVRKEPETFIQSFKSWKRREKWSPSALLRFVEFFPILSIIRVSLLYTTLF